MKKYIEIGNRLRLLRARLTQKEFAEKLGITCMTYQRYEYGERMPRGDALLRLTALFGVPVEWILSGTIKTGKTDEELLEEIRRTAWQAGTELSKDAEEQHLQELRKTHERINRLPNGYTEVAEEKKPHNESLRREELDLLAAFNALPPEERELQYHKLKVAVLEHKKTQGIPPTAKEIVEAMQPRRISFDPSIFFKREGEEYRQYIYAMPEEMRGPMLNLVRELYTFDGIKAVRKSGLDTLDKAGKLKGGLATKGLRAKEERKGKTIDTENKNEPVPKHQKEEKRIAG